jgi:hypothetical protein
MVKFIFKSNSDTLETGFSLPEVLFSLIRRDNNSFSVLNAHQGTKQYLVTIMSLTAFWDGQAAELMAALPTEADCVNLGTIGALIE